MNNPGTVVVKTSESVPYHLFWVRTCRQTCVKMLVHISVTLNLYYKVKITNSEIFLAHKKCAGCRQTQRQFFDTFYWTHFVEIFF